MSYTCGMVTYLMLFNNFQNVQKCKKVSTLNSVLVSPLESWLPVGLSV